MESRKNVTDVDTAAIVPCWTLARAASAGFRHVAGISTAAAVVRMAYKQGRVHIPSLAPFLTNRAAGPSDRRGIAGRRVRGRLLAGTGLQKKNRNHRGG